MKFGVREICDVVLKAKAAQKIGNKVFYAGEPVCYFDTLKTSSMEGASTAVYAQGGRGNARLMAWEGERTVTFTMEDALISPEGFMILSGAGLIEASEDKPIYQHVTETVDMANIRRVSISDTDASGASSTRTALAIHVNELPYMPKEQGENYAYVMLMKGGEIISEPFIPVHHPLTRTEGTGTDAKTYPWYPNIANASTGVVMPSHAANEQITADPNGGYWILVDSTDFNNHAYSNIYDDLDKDGVEDSDEHANYTIEDDAFVAQGIDTIYPFDGAIVDYYVKQVGNAQQIDITADKFGGNYYLEASTLFRDQNGVDMPAEFIIPNCKVQSNFTFTMASSGDPSSFTFTMDAFPDYTRFDKSKKVLAAIQIIKEAGSQELHRHSTRHEADHDLLF